jgi:ABC-type nitrate/sulfonate/bicarbonate transport system permease component
MKIERWSVVGVLIIIWFVATLPGFVNPLLVPSPQSVLRVVLSPIQWQMIAKDVAATCARLAIGFFLGGTAGIALGVAMGRSKKIYSALEFLVDFFRSIPVAALFPLFIVFFGIGNPSKIATAAWSTALIVVVQTMYGVRSCSPIRERFAKTLGASRFQILTTIVLPEATPFILAGIRTGLSIALIVVIMTEMFLGTPSGLGQRIFNAGLLYETPQLYFYIAVTGILGYGINRGSVFFENRFLAWQGASTR